MSFLSLNNVIKWESTPIGDMHLEQIVDQDDFQNPWFLKKGLVRSRAVGLIPNTGTAFLIADNLIMSNWHVFRNKDWADKKTILFDVEQDEDGSSIQSVKVKLRPDSFFYSNELLDFSVVGVEGIPGQTQGVIDIRSPGVVTADARVNIIQHPGAGFKKIAIRNNGIKYYNNEIIQYWTDTEHGSSGSPLFDDKWEIIGLHYKHDEEGTPDKKIFYNEGHQIIAILLDLRTKFPSLLQ